MFSFFFFFFFTWNTFLIFKVSLYWDSVTTIGKHVNVNVNSNSFETWMISELRKRNFKNESRIPPTDRSSEELWEWKHATTQWFVYICIFSRYCSKKRIFLGSVADWKTLVTEDVELRALWEEKLGGFEMAAIIVAFCFLYGHYGFIKCYPLLSGVSHLW